MLSPNGTYDHYEIVDQAHAATRLGQTISVGRNNQHNAPQRTDEYAMLDRSGRKASIIYGRECIYHHNEASILVLKVLIENNKQKDRNRD